MTDKIEEQRNKALHTKSQAGRTQKARPPAARLEGQTLRTPAELYTAWREGGGKGEEERRDEETEKESAEEGGNMQREVKKMKGEKMRKEGSKKETQERGKRKTDKRKTEKE